MDYRWSGGPYQIFFLRKLNIASPKTNDNKSLKVTAGCTKISMNTNCIAGTSFEFFCMNKNNAQRLKNKKEFTKCHFVANFVYGKFLRADT